MNQDQPPQSEPPQESPAAPAGQGRILDLAIDRELQDSYLTYAMSTIMDRALPDVRDGLKPSQRRILVAMNDLHLSPRSKHIKCAKIAGDTSGNYHPHGESVVYPTLVGMAQPWRMRCPLVNPQGNFGSIDGDPPAAMRYTEARLAGPAMDVLEDLKLETVDFQPNYDDRLMEPMVLPGKFPNLLINGGVGIAVGMATSLPPHNPGEICDGIVAVLDNPEITLEELMRIIPGPDFPTGGTICGREGIGRGYATGKANIALRAKTHFEEGTGGKTLIVVTEIPYQILKTTLIEQIVECVKKDRIEEIANVHDYSGRAGMRLVVECRKDADPNVVLNGLWRYTSLQATFSINNIALVNRQPRLLGLKELIQAFIDHRREVISRRTRFLLRQAQQQAHLKEGLIWALFDIDEVIKLIRSSASRDEAIDKLTQRSFRIPPKHPMAPKLPERFLKASAANAAKLSRTQAEAIGRMPLISLVGLEVEKLLAEYAELALQILQYEQILAQETMLLGIIRAETLDVRTRHANPRRTVIEGQEVQTVETADLIPRQDVVVTISHTSYAKRLPTDAYRTQGRGGKGVIGAGAAREDDFTEHLFVASTHDDLLCFTNTGRVFKIKVYEIPESSRTARGRAIVNILDLRPEEGIRAFLPVSDFEKHGEFLTFATEAGLVKRTSLKLFQNVHRGGLIAINLRPKDHLMDVVLTSGRDNLLLCTRNGLAIRFDENDVRAMGRAAAGVKGISLAKSDVVVAMVRADDQRQLLTACANGYGKRTPMGEYLVQPEAGPAHPQKRGGKGRLDIRTSDRNGPVVAAISVGPEDQMMLITEKGMVVRTKVGEVRETSRGTQGVRVISLKDQDRLGAVARVAEDPLEKAAANGPPAPETDES